MDGGDDDDSMDAKCMKYAGEGSKYEKGFVSNCMTFVIMVVGVALRIVWDGEWTEGRLLPARLVLAAGLFGFAGGITNWLAVKMLFDEIPGVYGSGIIPKQFKQIRRTIKTMIMDTFFDPEFLRSQVAAKVGAFTRGPWLKAKLDSMIDSPKFDEALDAKLKEIASQPTPAGMMVAMMGLKGSTIKPFIKPMVSSMMEHAAPAIEESLASEGPDSPILLIRNQVDAMMEERLATLTAARVKRLVEAVMRNHLGWLVVWGNIFGGLIGVVSEAAGY